MRRPEWKQDNPQDQIIQISSGIQGYAIVLDKGLYSDNPERLKEIAKDIQKWCLWINECAKLLPQVGWPNEPHESDVFYLKGSK